MGSCKKHRRYEEGKDDWREILTGSDAELLSRTLSEVKTKVYEEPETSSEDVQALDGSFRVSGRPRMMDRRKKNVRRILAPNVSALC
jgi:hypothetical protein